MVNNHLTFMEKEIPTEGKGHNHALHISIKCMDYTLARVLIDNGSSFKIMPKYTLEQLPYNKNHLKTSSTIVKPFNDSKREIMGEIEIPVKIGSFSFQISFQVMDIKSTYTFSNGNTLLPTSKLKFIVDDKLIIVSGEKDNLVSCPKPSRYSEAAEEALEMSFRSLEIVSTAYIETKPKREKTTNAMATTARIMMEKGRQGMGFKPNLRGAAKELRVRSLKIIKSLYEIFINGGFVNQMEEHAKDREDNP
ncbi:hypothetical protein CR513_11027, partial [Mucuna pruriens]